MQPNRDGGVGGGGVRYDGHNPETERLITEVVARLPEPVASFVHAHCAFLSLGVGHTAGWRGPFWLIVLRDDLTPADIHAQSLVAHQIAHAWLQHNQDQADDERHVAALTRTWGFNDKETEGLARRYGFTEDVGYCDRAMAAQLPHLQRSVEEGAPWWRAFDERRALLERLVDPTTAEPEWLRIAEQLARRTEWFGSKPPTRRDMEARMRALRKVVAEARTVQRVRVPYAEEDWRMMPPIELPSRLVDAWIERRLKSVLTWKVRGRKLGWHRS